MGFGDVKKSVSPKICMIAAARNGGTISSRYFTPFDCHDAHAVSAALCLAAALLTKGTLAYVIVDQAFDTNHDVDVIIEHVSGVISTTISVMQVENELTFPQASFVRTARPLFDGYVFVPGEALEWVKPLFLSRRLS